MNALDLKSVPAPLLGECALVVEGQSTTFGDLLALVEPKLKALETLQGPFCLVAQPDLTHLIWLYAAMSAQVPVVLLHPRWTDGQLADFRRRYGLVWAADREGLHEEAAFSGGNSISWDPLTQFVLTTSGSTGAPKAVQLSLDNLVASAEASAANLPWQAGDNWLLSLPYAHIGGLSVLTRSLHGRVPVVVESGRFSDLGFVRELAQKRVTCASLVPTQLSDLLDLGQPIAKLWPSLRVMLVGGAPCPATLRHRARAAGVPSLFTYGMTEISSQVATQPVTDLRRDIAAEANDVGFPLNGYHIRLGTEGALEVKGPSVMLGYAGEPSPADEWFQTRDRARLNEDGRLVVLGRADNVIISGGENISPEWVESELLGVPGTRGVIVVGVPHPRWGEAVVCLILKSTGQSEASVATALDETARKRLPDFARPKAFLFVSQLPMLPTGKVDRLASQKVALTQLSFDTDADEPISL